MTDAPDGPVVVLLGDRSAATRSVFHALERGLGDGVTLRAILEEPPPRATLARRRARRLGWPTVAGQVAFVLTVLPVLRLSGRQRTREIETHARLDTSPIDGPVYVRSVNDPAALAALLDLSPALVVVHGTRIISERILRAVDAPFVNLHMGITPRYRGVHGGYWALADGRPDLAGTTVHLVDEGIDTGAILGQATFAASRRDSIATYPALHLACGLPVLVDVARRVLDRECPPPAPVEPMAGAEESQLRWHPTVWGYLATRLRRHVS